MSRDNDTDLDNAETAEAGGSGVSTVCMPDAN